MWDNDFQADLKYLKRATKVSVTDDPIPHGLSGFRKPWCCTCPTCKTAGRKYNRDKQSEYRQRRRQQTDELAAKRKARTGKGPPISTAGLREAAAKRTESRDSVAKRRNRTPGDMERAVIEECATIENTKPTLVVAAKNLGRSVDDLSGNMKTIALYNSTMKQLMATMAELRGDTADKRAAGRKKSGGRLATVGALTKVKRA